MSLLSSVVASVLLSQSCANRQCGTTAGYAPAVAGYTYHWGPAYRYPPLIAAPVPAPTPVKSWHRTADGRTVWGWLSGGAILFHGNEQPKAPAKAACCCTCGCDRCGDACPAPPDHTPPTPRIDTRPEVPIRYDAPPAPR